MKIIPEFYKSFACLASDCPDTCCKDWDIVIDDNTLDFYRTVPEIAKRVKTDKDGDKIISFENGICPFLTQKGLCNIQQKHGAEKLCETCRSFPRITEDYTLFEEHMLTLACPEAARLMIISHDRFSFMENSIAGSCDEYDSKMMSFLLRSRHLTAEILRGEQCFSERINAAIDFTEYVQQLIDDENFSIENLDSYSPTPSDHHSRDHKNVFLLHKKLDVMDKQWLDHISDCADATLPDSIDEELASLALYYLARYYLTAISSYDVITTVKRAYCAAVVCAAVISNEKAENDAARRALIYQKYSKEIEHSDENLDFFTEAFFDIDIGYF